jgi:osmotically-inducible protein OsmY
MCVRHLALLVIVVLAGRGVAAQPRIETDATRDVLQTVQARKLLFADPDLAGLNIGVTVHNRVATLWGPVPAAEFTYRAEQCLRSMTELAEIRNELFVSDRSEPAKLPLKLDTRPIVPPENVPPPLPKELRPVPGAPGVLMLHDPAQSKPTTTSLKAGPVDRMVLPALGTPQQDKLAPSPLVYAADQALTAAVREFLQSKISYQEVQFAVREGAVYLRPGNGDANAVQEAARAIAKLPGVAGVIVVDKTSQP